MYLMQRSASFNTGSRSFIFWRVAPGVAIHKRAVQAKSFPCSKVHDSDTRASQSSFIGILPPHNESESVP
jgi:hypothetical protein